MISLTEALECDFAAKDMEHPHGDNEQALELRLDAAEAFEEMGLYYDAAFSYDRAGKDAYYIRDEEERASCKLIARKYFLLVHQYLQDGVDIRQLTSYSGIEDSSRLRFRLLMDAAYAGGHAASALYACGYHRFARRMARRSADLFAQLGMMPRNKDVADAIARHVPDAFSRRE